MRVMGFNDMEDSVKASLERLFYDKVLLYDDLLHCFMRERDCLIRIDMDGLWNISREKNNLCERISSVRKDILSLLGLMPDADLFDLHQIIKTLPYESRAGFQAIALRIMKIKSEIESLRKDNKTLIDDALSFLDEMIFLLAGVDHSKTVYNKNRRLKKWDHNYMQGREV